MHSDNGVVPPSCQPSIGTSGATFPLQNVLRREQKLQQEVQLGLKELTENVKTGNTQLKSQRGGPVDAFVGNWVNEYVLIGQSKQRVAYNQLTSIQWMAGFCRMMKGSCFRK